MTTLFKIIEELKILEQLEDENQSVDTETGEITIKEQETLELLKNELVKNFDTKALGYRNMIKHLDNQIGFCAEEIKRIQSQKKKFENIQKRMKEMLKFALEILRIEKKEYPAGEVISLRNYKIYEYDEAELKKTCPQYFQVEYTLDKNKAKEDFKTGKLATGIKEIKTLGLSIK